MNWKSKPIEKFFLQGSINYVRDNGSIKFGFLRQSMTFFFLLERIQIVFQVHTFVQAHVKTMSEQISK